MVSFRYFHGQHKTRKFHSIYWFKLQSRWVVTPQKKYFMRRALWRGFFEKSSINSSLFSVKIRRFPLFFCGEKWGLPPVRGDRRDSHGPVKVPLFTYPSPPSLRVCINMKHLRKYPRERWKQLPPRFLRFGSFEKFYACYVVCFTASEIGPKPHLIIDR